MRMLVRSIVICSMLAAPSAFEASDGIVSNPRPDVIWAKFDEYGGISSKKEKFRLENFVIQLRQEKTSNAFIVARAGRLMPAMKRNGASNCIWHLKEFRRLL